MNPLADVLVVEGVRKTFEAENTPVRAARGADLRVAAGDFVALMGPSGCREVHPDQPGGRAGHQPRMDRRREQVTGRSEDDLSIIRRQHIGIVFQFFNLLESMTAQENVTLPAVIAGTRRRPAETRARDLLDLLGLGEKAKSVPGRCREANANAWPSPAPWPTSPPSCWPTSRRVPSTPTAGTRSSSC